MGSPPPTPISIKLYYNGETRKFSLALKDLAVGTFGEKLGTILRVPHSHQLQIERFSDSSSAYIPLEASNAAAYKQLYRAAKAKSKLKLRITATDMTPKAIQVNTQPAKSEVSIPEPPKEDVSKPPTSRMPRCSWQVCCNSCDQPMADVHYHCSICDNGDYDLCESCVQSGKLCSGDGHWLIKRVIKNGQVFNSTTFKIRKPLPETKTPKDEVLSDNEKPGIQFPQSVEQTMPRETKNDIESMCTNDMLTKIGTEKDDTVKHMCNSCMSILPEKFCVTCQDCDDYDLCLLCHGSRKHGHNPAHSFKPTSSDACISAFAEALCAPGRNVHHAAICDGCEKTIFGVRNKCLDCPDFDLCNACHGQVSHGVHRFVPIYEPLEAPTDNKPRHVGVYCDGPLCSGKPYQTYIEGVRFKCAVCNDTDFCARCEAHPSNKHNQTHPVIKFKTVVKDAVVSTTHYDGKSTAASATLGDKSGVDSSPKLESKSSQTTNTLPLGTTINATRIVPPAMTGSVMSRKADLDAHFVRDTVPDGSQLTPGIQFVQTWSIRNPGPQAWPIGCHVRRTGGDAMSGESAVCTISSSALAGESNSTDRVVVVGETFDFSVSLRAPVPEGRYITYWRVKDAQGNAFGHKLWCDIFSRRSRNGEEMQRLAHQYRTRQSLAVRMQKMSEQRAKLIEDLEAVRKTILHDTPLGPVPVQHEIVPPFAPSDVPPFVDESDPAKEEGLAVHDLDLQLQGSQMVFPTLEKESPTASTHEDKTAGSAESAADLKSVKTEVPASENEAPKERDVSEQNEEVFEDIRSAVVSDSEMENGFLTDEEYDLLDASDEEELS